MTMSTARHRKAARPLTPLTSAGPAARRGLAVAASSGLALTMIASGAAASSTATEVGDSAGSLRASGLGAIAAGARAAVTTNAAIKVDGGADLSVEDPQVTATAPVVQEAVAQTAGDDEGVSGSASSASVDSAAATGGAATAAPASANGSSVASLAMQYVGYSYVYAAADPSVGFDCSGLVSYVYAQMGISVPHSSSAIYSAGTVVSASEAQAGDVIWWPGHVAIYMGNGMMVDAVSPGSGVQYHSVYSGATYLRIA